MNEPDDRWLDVLAGRRPADDAETRQAESVRIFFERQGAADLQGPLNALQEQRLLAHLRSRESAEAPRRAPATTTAARPNPWFALWRWVFPPGEPAGLRFAVIAALVLGVAVAPRLFDRGPAEEAPIDKQALPRWGGLNTLSSADPAAKASRIADLLRDAGFSTTVAVEGDVRRVEADIPPAELAVVRERLAAEGVRVPDSGHLSLRILRSP